MIYSPELAAAICDQLADGRSLRQICASPDMPDRRTVGRWVVQYAEFREQYEAARLLWADELFEEIADLSARARSIAEDAETRGFNSHAAVGALREEIRAKMWVCARLRPDRYGDRTAITGANGRDLIPERAADPERAAQALLLFLRGLPEAEPTEGESASTATENGAAAAV
jgi:hypothetical protein